jgi:hypothetical protein
MKHRASRRFWERYHALPVEVQRLADANTDCSRATHRTPDCISRRLDDSGPSESDCTIAPSRLNQVKTCSGSGSDTTPNTTACSVEGDRAAIVSIQ